MAAARGGGELWEAGKYWTLKKGEVLLDLTQLRLLHPDAPSPSPRQHGRGDHHPTPPPCLDPAPVVLCLDWSQRADARPARDSSVTLGGSVSLSEPVSSSVQWRPQFPTLTILLWVGKALCHLRINRDPEILSEAVKIPPLLPLDPPTARGGGPRTEVPDGGIGGISGPAGHDHRLPPQVLLSPCSGDPVAGFCLSSLGNSGPPTFSDFFFPAPWARRDHSPSAGWTRNLGRKCYPFLHFPAPFRPGFSQGSLLLAFDFGEGGGYRTGQTPTYEGWSVLSVPSTPWLAEGPPTKTRGHAQVGVSLAQRAGAHPLSWCLDGRVPV